MCVPEDIFTAEKRTHYLLTRTLLRGKHDLNFSPQVQPGSWNRWDPPDWLILQTVRWQREKMVHIIKYMHKALSIIGKFYSRCEKTSNKYLRVLKVANPDIIIGISHLPDPFTLNLPVVWIVQVLAAMWLCPSIKYHKMRQKLLSTNILMPHLLNCSASFVFLILSFSSLFCSSPPCMQMSEVAIIAGNVTTWQIDACDCVCVCVWACITYTVGTHVSPHNVNHQILGCRLGLRSDSG